MANDSYRLEDYTDRELAVLEHLQYINTNVLTVADVEENVVVVTYKKNGKDVPAKRLKIDKNLKVGDILHGFSEKKLDNLRKHGNKVISGGELTGNEWAAVINYIKNNPKLSSLEVFKNEVYKNKTNIQTCYKIPGNDDNPNFIIAYKGTSGDDEWKDNYKSISSYDTERLKNAKKFFDDIKKENSKAKFMLVGHSKGANKAVFITLLDKSDSIQRCVGLNGQGVSRKFFKKEKNNTAFKKNAGKIINYATKKDFISILMKKIGGRKYLKDFSEKRIPEGRKSRFKRHHSLGSFWELKKDENKNLTLDIENSFKEKKQSKSANALEKIINGALYVTPNSRKEILGDIAADKKTKAIDLAIHHPIMSLGYLIVGLAAGSYYAVDYAKSRLSETKSILRKTKRSSEKNTEKKEEGTFIERKETETLDKIQEFTKIKRSSEKNTEKKEEGTFIGRKETETLDKIPEFTKTKIMDSFAKDFINVLEINYSNSEDKDFLESLKKEISNNPESNQQNNDINNSIRKK